MSRLLMLVSATTLALVACTNDTPTAPSWYSQRSELPSCGIDEEYEDGYPNHEARECFRRAFDEARPAELTRLQFGEEGESIRAHFRVLGDERYEIVGEHFSSSSEDDPTHLGWVRYDCDRFVFIDDPGAEVDGVPVINAEGECVLADQVVE